MYELVIAYCPSKNKMLLRKNMSARFCEGGHDAAINRPSDRDHRYKGVVHQTTHLFYRL